MKYLAVLTPPPDVYQEFNDIVKHAVEDILRWNKEKYRC